MPECVLVSGEGRRRLIETAKAVGCKVRPQEVVMCEACRNGHVIQIDDPEVVDSRYGMAPVDPADETGTREKPDKFVNKPYCRTCFAYHSSAQVCPGERAAVEDWTKKVIG